MVFVNGGLRDFDLVPGASTDLLAASQRFIGTDVAENDAGDQSITDRLYGGDESDRIRQEIVLGIGGERMLRALGFAISTYHLNEGHAAFLALSLLLRHRRAGGAGADVDKM